MRHAPPRFKARFLPIGLVSALVLLSSVEPAKAQTPDMEPLRALALELVNTSRDAEDLPALQLESKLTKAAQSHADDMLARDFYAHESPEGSTVSDRYQAAGGSKWLLTAENIAKCDGCEPPLSEAYVRQMHEGWMDSPGHRENILRKGLDHFGFGMAVDQGGALYAVQTFAGPGTSNGGGAADAKPLTLQEQAELALAQVNERRKKAGRASLELSQALSEAALSILPDPDDERFSINGDSNAYDVLSDEERRNWSSLTLLSASCGGCGVGTLAADVKHFMQRWLERPEYGKMLLSEEASHMGFAMAANGKGRKIGLGVIGKRR